VTSIAQQVVDALSYGSLYALFALGIALIFGIMRLVNFAHGELAMAGAYVAVILSGAPWPVLIVVPILATILVALVLDRVAFKPIRGANPAALLITSFAVSYLLQNLAVFIFGSLPRTGMIFPGLNGAFELAGVIVPWINLVTVVVTAALLAALGLFLHRTLVGLEMRAAAEDFRMAQLLGVRSDVVIAVAFGLSGLLAAVAALFLVVQQGVVTPAIGQPPILAAFIATIIGGLGSLSGAVLGAYIVGILTVALQAYLPVELGAFRDAFVYAGIIALLVFRPDGLLKSRSTTTRV
jgi:branched-chain amino acid transport system permease protein